MKHLVYFVLATFLISCSSELNSLGDIMGEGHFRGNSIGDKRATVEKLASTDNIVNRNEDNISCELAVAKTELTVTYDFDEETLYSIQADMFFADSTARNHFQTELIADYNAKYGEVDMDGGFLVWQEGGKVEFTLADESIEFGQPKLSLTIYNFDY